MANGRRNVIAPDGTVGTVPDDQYEGALAAGYKSTTEQDVSMAAERKEQSGALGFGKALAERAAEVFNPADLAAGLLSLPTAPEIAGGIAKRIGAPEAVTSTIERIEQLPQFRAEKKIRTAVRETLLPVVEPLTTGRLETGLGITTPEAREARIQEHPAAGLALLPLFLLKGKLPPMTAAGAEARALALEAKSLDAAAKAASLVERAGVSEASIVRAQAQAVKAAEKAGLARESALARRAYFEQHPVLEKVDALVASGKLTTPGLLEPLGTAARGATERSIRAALEVAPGIGQKSQMVKDLVARSIATGVGSAVEMPFYAMGMAANEAALGDHELTAEQSVAAMTDGALMGFALGAGFTAAAGTPKVVAKAAGDVSRSGRDWLVKNFPRLSSAITGASEESAQTLIRNRKRIVDGEDLATILEESMPAPERPVEPTLAVPPEMPAPFEPAPLPEKPPLTLPQINKAAVEASDAFKRMFAIHSDMSKEAQGFILKERAAGAVTDHFDAQIAKARSAYLEAAGVPKTPEQVAAFESIPQEVSGYARTFLSNLATEAERRLNSFVKNTPTAVPTSEVRDLREIIGNAKALSRNPNAMPSDVFLAIKKFKADAYTAARPIAPPGVPVTTTPEQLAARSVADEIGGIFRSANENPDIWGKAAAYEAEGNALWTDLDNDIKQLWKAFSKKGAKVIRGTADDIDAGKVATWARGLASSESGVPTLDGAASVDTLRVYERVMRNLDQWQQFTGRAADAIEYGKRGTMQSMADAMAGTREAMAATEREAILSASNEILEREIAANSARIKELNKQAKRADEAQRKVIEAQIKAIEGQNKALTGQYNADLDAFEDAMKARSQAAKEQAALLRSRASKAIVDDFPLATMAVGAVSGAQVAGGAISLGLKGAKYVATAERAAKVLAHIERAARKTEQVVNQTADSLVAGAPRAALVATTANLTSKRQRELYEERSKKIALLATDPSQMEAHLNSVAGGAEDVAPKIAGHLKAASATAVAQLAAEIPQPPPNLPPFERANWKPNDAQVRSFNETYDAITNPTSVMTRISAGTATRKEVRTLRAAYPSVVNDLQKRVIERIKENPDLPAERRRMVSMLLGVDVDGQTTSQIGGSAQAVHQQQQALQQPQIGGQVPLSRARALNLSNRAEYNTAARREAQRGVGSWNKRQ